MPSPPMATGDDCQAIEAAEFRKKLDAMVTAAAKKRYDATRTRVLTVTVLLEEKQHVVAVLVEEARTVVSLIEPPSPMLPLDPTGGAAPSDNDYEVVVIANVYVLATAVPNIRSIISVTLDLSSTHYA
jgi:hypothetical protein